MGANHDLFIEGDDAKVNVSPTNTLSVPMVHVYTTGGAFTHSNYFTAAKARELAAQLIAVADEVDRMNEDKLHRA